VTAPLAVYIHIPFCTVKCGYCDFNAYAGMDALKEEYMAAIAAEIRAAAPLLRGRTVATVAFGGGTPSEVPVPGIAAALDAIRSAAPLAHDAEVSLEANPGTTDSAHLRGLRAAGVTRISFGAQSFDSGELAFLDRIHSPEATTAAVALAREAGLESVGLDLIYALPGQSLTAWTATLDRAIALRPDHISTYALTVEDGTPLGHRVAAGRVTPLDGDAAADMYESAASILATAGYSQYELSNYALAGHESRHNRIYWTDGDYLAIGAGAHGYLAGERYENVAHPRLYIERVATAREHDARPALLSAYTPDPATAMFDWVTLALRLTAGFAPAAFEARFGRRLDDALGEPLSACEQAGLVVRTGSDVRLTPRGRLLHAEVAVQLLAHLDSGR
jgi:oxygen-independent coproporphyrinogen-3 oxidase